MAKKKTENKEEETPNKLNMTSTPPPLAKKRVTDKYTFQPFNDAHGSKMLCYKNDNLMRAIIILPYCPTLHKWDDKKLDDYLEEKLNELTNNKKK